jgi:hypothetical protein
MNTVEKEKKYKRDFSYFSFSVFFYPYIVRVKRWRAEEEIDVEQFEFSRRFIMAKMIF